jgi:sugar phosphate isomerase/epimerase
MILSGLADEAGNDIDTQIRAHRAIGWNHIELRTVDGENVAGVMADDAFDRMAAKIEQAGVSASGFGSAIGNWARHINDDFQRDVDDLKKSIPRMHRLGAKAIRTMSWVGDEVDEKTWRDEVIRRYRELTKIAEDGGVIIAHENCTGWASLNPANMCDLMDTIDSPNLRVLLDIGNTVNSGTPPLDWYEGVKPFICYIHIKDCPIDQEGARFPGEGDAPLMAVLTDQFRLGYDGVLAIEPHIDKVIHLADNEPDPQRMYNSYIEYGKRAIELVDKARRAASEP